MQSLIALLEWRCRRLYCFINLQCLRSSDVLSSYLNVKLALLAGIEVINAVIGLNRASISALVFNGVKTPFADDFSLSHFGRLKEVSTA